MVSIIIPCYNYEKYIGNCIKSVFTQTYTNFELIVINDGSTDRCDKIIKEFLKIYDFKYIVQNNIGLVRTVNKGISLSRGEFISLLNADDLIYQNNIEQSVRFMNSHHDVGLVSSSCDFIDEKNMIIKKLRLCNRIGNINDFINEKLKFPAPTTVFRVTAINKEKAISSDFHIDDLQITLNVFNNGWRAANLSQISGAYRKHALNMSNNLLLEYKTARSIYTSLLDSLHLNKMLVRNINDYYRPAYRSDNQKLLHILSNDLKKISGQLSLKSRFYALLVFTYIIKRNR